MVAVNGFSVFKAQHRKHCACAFVGNHDFGAIWSDQLESTKQIGADERLAFAYRADLCRLVHSINRP